MVDKIAIMPTGELHPVSLDSTLSQVKPER